jgi:RimJ/RimL family protein N-acetyltransferase
MQAAGQRFAFAIEWQGRVVGSTSYANFQPWDWAGHVAQQRSDRPDAVEIGYTWLAASAQRTRCNSEAKYLLLQQAFDFWQVHRVFLKTDARNQRSRAAIERLGARLDGVLRNDMPAVDGTVRSSAYYSLLPEEWPAVKANLEAKLAANREAERA